MNKRDDTGYKELGIAVVRQAITDFDEASRYLTKSTSEEQYNRVLRNCEGHLSEKEANVLYKENRCRWIIKDVTGFLESEWCELCINGADGNYFLKQLRYRDWRRQCIADGIYIPRGNEYIPRRDFTDAENKRYKRHKNFRGYYSQRNEEDIASWFKSLSHKERLQIYATRSFDADTFHEILGVDPLGDDNK